MRLEILGTRGNILPSAPRYARHSGILIDARILLDLGEATYLRYRPQHIFITHLHPDHAAFLRTAVATDAEISLPEATPKVPGARVMSRPVQSGSYRIVPVPTVHSLKVRSLGYVVEKGGRRVFFSSDLVSIQRRYHRRLRRLDLVITEGSYIRRGGLVRTDPASGRSFGHAGIPKPDRVLPPLHFAHCHHSLRKLVLQRHPRFHSADRLSAMVAGSAPRATAWSSTSSRSGAGEECTHGDSSRWEEIP